MPPRGESILGLKVEAVQGKQVSIEWTETSGGVWEWWHDPGISRVVAGALALRRGPQGPALVASGKASPHASCSGASWDASPVNIGA